MDILAVGPGVHHSDKNIPDEEDRRRDASIFKPSVNLNKKGYAKLVEHMKMNIEDHNVANIAVDTMTSSLRETLGFDPASKQTEEVRMKNYENKQRKAKEKGVSVYEMTTKPRYELLKQQYPDIPPSQVIKLKPRTDALK
jgi:hypothetical protein